jgi:Tol biopolymer transport system component
MFVRDRDGEARQIFSAPAGLHAHFPVWSPDQSFIYFVQGSIPEPMDIWRISASGRAPERITHHDARVSHPVFLDGRTLLYLASDAEGAGLSIHSVDVRERRARRVSAGIERYSSLAASSDGRRLVATMARPRGAFWRLPLHEGGADPAAARRIPLTTGNGVAPRLGPGFLVYVTQDAEGDSIWKLQGDAAVRLWSAPETRITGGPAISRDGRRIAFVAQRQRQAALYSADADGTNARILAPSLRIHGAPAWAPDGRSLTVGVLVDGTPRLHRVPLDGSPPAPLVPEHSMDPVWSPDGGLLTYSGPDIGATFPVKIVTPGAVTNPRRTLTLSRGSRHLCYMPGGRSLLVLRGEIGHKNVWMIDLDTGAERQLTTFDPGFTIRDFDISPDGRELVVEQVQEHSDIVLIQLAR